MLALLAALALAPGQEPCQSDGILSGLSFVSLFNGKDLKGWKGYKRPSVPKAWRVVDGELTVVPTDDGGDICTAKEYGDFELELEWNTSKEGNSGIIYRAGEDYEASWQTGPEYQIFDDYRGGPGKIDSHSAGALYDLYVPTKLVSRPPGEWNQTRIVCKGNHIEHWLNGTKIVSAEVGSTDWNARIEKSKFKAFPHFATKKKGYILIQDHGHEMRYRKIRVREM